MAWHESKFWRSSAVAGLVLLAAMILKMDTQAQTDDVITITGTPGTTTGTGARRTGRQPSRLDALMNAQFIPWDLSRGIFLKASDSGDRIVMWNFGSDWESSITFEVASSQTFQAGQK